MINIFEIFEECNASLFLVLVIDLGVQLSLFWVALFWVLDGGLLFHALLFLVFGYEGIYIVVSIFLLYDFSSWMPYLSSYFASSLCQPYKSFIECLSWSSCQFYD